MLVARNSAPNRSEEFKMIATIAVKVVLAVLGVLMGLFCGEHTCGLKGELVYTTTFVTRQEAHSALFGWIEVFYNRKRRYSALGHKSPVEFENLFQMLPERREPCPEQGC